MILALSRSKDSKASPPYLSLYHLSQAPFYGSGIFYADPDRDQALDMLQHLTQYSEEILFLTGPEGIGKSRLLEQYIERAEEHWRVCRLDGSNSVEAERLFQHIADCFHLDFAGLLPANLLQGLQQQLSALQEQQLPVLLVDDAHKLNDDALEIVMHLATLEGEHGRLVRVLLCGDSSLEAGLAAARFAGIPRPHRIELKPLDEVQTAAYLDARMAAAGYRGMPLFSDKEVRQIHRLTHGLPGQINDEAHELLMHRSAARRVDAPAVGRYVKVGIAATAIIGSVLGLHERINALLGGDERVMSVSSPERPVMRLAEEGSPWAMVIRDGERIQISCGAPASDTVGVRPLVAATAMLQQSRPMIAPLLDDVSPAPKQDEQTSPDSQESVQGEGAEMPEQASATPVVVAQAPGEQPPLVVKQDDSVENAGPAESAAQTEEAAPAELKLTGVSPSPVIGSDMSQRIVINGSGFVEGSKVAVSRAGKVEVLPADQMVFVNEGQIAIEVNTGSKPTGWALQVSTPDNRRSNVIRFQVMAPPREQTPAEAPVADVAAAPTAAETPVEPPAARVAPDEAETETRTDTPVPAVPASQERQPLQGHEWLAKQPKQHFTLQLLASSSRNAIERYAEQPSLAPPLAHFVMDKGGKELHILTQGSYASRQEAEQAARKLPQGSRPWMRSLESVQQVMKREASKDSGADVSFPSGGAGLKDTAWVWSQDPGRYTIQLAAAESEQAIEAAMRRIALPGELVVVQTLREGKPWYALIYGSFPTRDAARGTIERLPEALRRSGPWPRGFASLHDEISRSTPER